MTETRRALFLFPSDRMGGAERISRTLAQEALRSDDIEHLDCIALCWDRTGTLEAIEQSEGAAVRCARAPSHLLGLLAMVRFLLGKRYDLQFSARAPSHPNAICSFMRKVGLLKDRAPCVRIHLGFRTETHQARLVDPHDVCPLWKPGPDNLPDRRDETLAGSKLSEEAACVARRSCRTPSI